ncbi:retrotransposon protein, putative, ty1-copia subclass [Tanacetum coccineum]
MVRSMMNLTTLPLSFWDYALESATRILNMVPTKKVDKTPYELWYGKVPNLSYLKVWLCESLVKRDTPDKLEQRLLIRITLGMRLDALEPDDAFAKLSYCDAGFETDRDDTISDKIGYVFVLMEGGSGLKTLQSKQRLGIVPTINEPLICTAKFQMQFIMANELGVQEAPDTT